MTDPQPNTPPEISRPNSRRALTVIGFLALGGLAFYFFLQSNRVASTTQTENVQLQQELANVKESLQQLKTAEIYRTEEQQIAKSRLQELAARGKRVAAILDGLKTETDSWKAVTGDLLGSDKGKAVAANAKALEQFYGIYKKDRPAVETADELRTALDTLMVPVNTALESKHIAYVPNDTIPKELGIIEQKAQDTAEAYRKLNRQLASILSSLPQDVPADAPMLTAAIERLEKTWAAQENELVAAKVAEARREGQRKVADAKAEAERQTADAEAQAAKKIAAAKVAATTTNADVEVGKVVGQAAETKRAAEEAERKKEQERKKAELRKEALVPEVLSTLAPFVTPGYAQLNTTGGDLTYAKGALLKPVSLAAIKGIGALDQSPHGLDRLGQAGSHWQSDRPKWLNAGVGVKHETRVKAQEYLIKYGDILVEEGKLLP